MRKRREGDFQSQRTVQQNHSNPKWLLIWIEPSPMKDKKKWKAPLYHVTLGQTLWKAIKPYYRRGIHGRGAWDLELTHNQTSTPRRPGAGICSSFLEDGLYLSSAHEETEQKRLRKMTVEIRPQPPDGPLRCASVPQFCAVIKDDGFYILR